MQTTPPKSKFEKIARILGITLGVLFACVFILAGIVFYNLPSAKQIGGFFKKDKPAVQKLNAVSNDGTVAEVEPAIVATPAQHNDSRVGVIEPETKEMQADKIREFLDEKTPAMTFCSKLNQAKSGPIDFGFAQKQIQKPDGTTQTEPAFNSEVPDDLRLEAIKPFFKTVLRQPEMQKLVSMIIENEDLMKDPDAAVEQGLFDKAVFYKQAYSAYSEMKDNLPEYESVVDRTYLMYKLNDLVALKPELQNDPRIMKFCEESENDFNTYADVDFANEKKSFERLVQELGVNPQAIKYDPNYKTELKLDFSNNNLQIGGGWLNEIMPTPPESIRQ